jgi:hypothetical protein
MDGPKKKLYRITMKRKRAAARLTSADSGMNGIGKKGFRMGGIKGDVSGRVLYL